MSEISNILARRITILDGVRLGGILVPFPGIKLIDLALSAVGLT